MESAAPRVETPSPLVTPSHHRQRYIEKPGIGEEEQFYKESQLAEGLIDHDEYFSLWRSHHIKMVERMVGAKPGTGGSEGVGYLQKTLDKKFFPELWDARTYLSSKHESEGCPFAK